MVSDFLDQPQSYRRPLYITNRKHDVIAVDLNDPLEANIAKVGMLALEDAESGQIVWVDTNDPVWRKNFAKQNAHFEAAKRKVFSNAAIDRIEINTNQDYVQALTLFFQNRARRVRARA